MIASLFLHPCPWPRLERRWLYGADLRGSRPRRQNTVVPQVRNETSAVHGGYHRLHHSSESSLRARARSTTARKLAGDLVFQQPCTIVREA